MDDIEYLDFEDLPSAKPSDAYVRLTNAGWVYDGVHGRGGGMGYHFCHEFAHPAFGRLSFSADISDQSDAKERRELEQAAPYLDFSSWFLMLDGMDCDWSSLSRGVRVDSGETLDELESVLKQMVEDVLD